MKKYGDSRGFPMRVEVEDANGFILFMLDFGYEWVHVFMTIELERL